MAWNPERRRWLARPQTIPCYLGYQPAIVPSTGYLATCPPTVHRLLISPTHHHTEVGLARATGHPEAGHLASSVEAFAATGAPLTIRRGIQLKIALKYTKPPVWRSVQLPLTATLGDLHAAILVLFSWDGNYLYVFDAGGVYYSDRCYELDEGPRTRKMPS